MKIKSNFFEFFSEKLKLLFLVRRESFKKTKFDYLNYVKKYRKGQILVGHLVYIYIIYIVFVK